jgi:hypothetical protein
VLQGEFYGVVEDGFELEPFCFGEHALLLRLEGNITRRSTLRRVERSMRREW